MMRTVDVEDVVVEGLAHRVGGHTAVRSVVGLVQVLNVEVGAGDDRVGRHVVVHLDPVHLLRPEDEERRHSQSRPMTSATRTLGGRPLASPAAAIKYPSEVLNSSMPSVSRVLITTLVPHIHTGLSTGSHGDY